ncbi:hypothetical protein [Paenibacillus dauci]|uniref:hypothetical protein n=1 Tax=Paenibacillus dauci TaxID=1567106 RepID=UPI0012E0AD40|nr:hypothetical protein [Paenibacillus dauci]
MKWLKRLNLQGIEVQSIMQYFGLYTILEKPALNTNDTFSINKDCSNFLLKHSEYGGFEKDDLFYNPYGVWALIKK